MSNTNLHLVFDSIYRFFTKESSKDALRNILAICIPAVLLFYTTNLDIAIAFAVGTLLASLTDLPGNRQDKKQTALWCIPLFFIASTSTVLSLHDALWLTPILLTLLGFGCALSLALGSRIATVGTLTLIVISFTIGLKPNSPLIFSISFFTGTVWFFSLSLLQVYLRPYRSLQYAMREGFSTLAQLLRTKAKCYDTEISLSQVYNELSLVHIQVSEQLENVRSLLLRESTLLKTEDTTSSHWLSRTYSLIDLYELMMAVDNDYETIREQLKDTSALPIIQKAIYALSDEIEACNGTHISTRKVAYNQHIIWSCLGDLDNLQRKASPDIHLLINPVISHIRQILTIVRDIQSNMSKAEPTSVPDVHYQHFIPAQPKINTLRKQLTFRSPIFIYALRMALLLGCSGLIGYFLPEYKYASWMILTIILVARPSYSNTQRRNYQRIVGSVLGIIIGMILTFFIHSPLLLLFLAALCLYGFFLFNRPDYLVSVIFVTIAIILSLNVHEGNIWDILGSRFAFTLLGSAFAILGCFALPINQRRMVSNVTDNLLDNFRGYHQKVKEALHGEAVSTYELRLVRKHAQTTLALFYDHAEQFRKDPINRRKDRQQMNHFQSLAYRIHAHLLGIAVSLTKSSISSEMENNLQQRLHFIQELLEDLHDSAQQFSPTPK